MKIKIVTYVIVSSCMLTNDTYSMDSWVRCAFAAVMDLTHYGNTDAPKDQPPSQEPVRMMKPSPTSAFDLCDADITQTPIGKSICYFLKRFILAQYISIVFARETLLWDHVYNQLEQHQQKINETFENSKAEYLEQLPALVCEQTGNVVTQDFLEQNFNDIIPIFFKELFDIFAQAGYAGHYLKMLKLSSSEYYQMLRAKHPNLLEHLPTQEGERFVPFDKTLRQLISRIVQQLPY